MKMNIIAIACSLANAVDDYASLLQSKRVSAHAEVQYAEVVKTVEHANGTSTKWSCAVMPCERHLCRMCPMIACDCFWKQGFEECPSCCKPGDDKCLEDKMKSMMTTKLKDMKAEMDYNRNYAKWERTRALNNRKDEDADIAWKRANLKHVRTHEDEQWKDGTKKHKSMVKEYTATKKHMNTWARSLSDEVATVKQFMDGAVRPRPMPQLPSGSCPPAPICPLPGKCPRCPKPTCPPCPPAPSAPCEKACPEDKYITDAIDAALKKEPYVACPSMDKFCTMKDSWPATCPAPMIMCPPTCPPMQDYCNQKDTWPADCPAPRIMCPPKCPPMGDYCSKKDTWPADCPAPRIMCPPACPPMGDYCSKKESWPADCPVPRIACPPRLGR